MDTEIHFSTIEKKLITLLADGLPHTKKEIAEHLGNITLKTVPVVVSNVRKKLHNKNEEIICELKGYSISYRHVRLLNIYT